MTSNQQTKTKHRYENKLSYNDRQQMSLLYLQGYAVYNIANSYHVTASTVEWHLRQMGVYIGNRQPSLWNRPIAIKQVVIRHTLSLSVTQQIMEHTTELLNEIDNYDRRLPETYKQYYIAAEYRRKERKANDAAMPKQFPHNVVMYGRFAIDLPVRRTIQ